MSSIIKVKHSLILHQLNKPIQISTLNVELKRISDVGIGLEQEITEIYLIDSAGSDLVQREAVVTNDQHVGVIPLSGTAKLTEPVLVLPVVVDDAEDRVPGVVDVIVIPPQVAMLGNRLIVWIVSYK